MIIIISNRKSAISDKLSFHILFRQLKYLFNFISLLITKKLLITCTINVNNGRRPQQDVYIRNEVYKISQEDANASKSS